MSAESRQKWINAATVLATDPTAKVRCPEKDDDDLAVRDIAVPTDPTKKERIISCPTCGAKNIMLIKNTQ